MTVGATVEVTLPAVGFHCHILEHEDVGMMGQFVVEVAP
jgi:FtsP/CotA-like multicopper oxidase with cupredoxin domain